MEQQLKKSVMYVDYEGLMTGLSHYHHLDTDGVLANLLKKARQNFEVQGAIVLGDWTRLTNRNQLERQGFICKTVYGPDTVINQEIEASIAEQIVVGNAAEVYILVNGVSDYTPILRQLRQADKESVLWTVSPPSLTDQALCSEWEFITSPESFATSDWPRQVILQAVALVADHLLVSNNESQLLMNRLLDRLGELPPFKETAETWLNVAVREQIILLQRVEDPSASPYIQLNRQHPFVQKGLQIRERILSVLSAMIVDRDWVAFSALEKAMQTSKPLAGDQSFRHAWLELLVAEEVLIAESVPQPDGVFQTTTLRPNLNHPIIRLHQQQNFNLVRLIVTIDNFIRRKGYKWMAVSTLLTILTRATTRVEARATLSLADEEALVEIDTVPSIDDPEFSVATVRLNSTHSLVQKCLTKRDDIILLADSMLTNRHLGMSSDVFVEELGSSGIAQEENEALFWIQLLGGERILTEAKFVQGPRRVVRLLRLRLEDPIVSQALDTMGQNL